MTTNESTKSTIKRATKKDKEDCNKGNTTDNENGQQEREQHKRGQHKGQ